MKRIASVALVLALVAALIPVPARGQNEEITVNKIKPAITTRPQIIGPSDSTGVRIETTGEMNPQVPNADGYVFLSAMTYCTPSTTNLTPVRVAASDWALRRTSTSVEAIHITCALDSWLQRMGGSHAAGASRGVKITALTIHQQIVTQDILYATFNKLATRRFVNATANDVGLTRGTATLPTTAVATPYATAVTITTPLYLPYIPGQDFNMDFSVELKNGTVYSLYGIGVSFSKL